MRIAVLGGGPGGLCFATLWKKRHPADHVRVIEQNPPDATWGFGVVFSDKALDFLRADDPATSDLIAPQMQHWRNITLVHRGEVVEIDGVGFSAIGRLALLQLLLKRAHDVGVETEHNRSIQSLDELGDVDLIVGADGLNSLARRTYPDAFNATLDQFTNKFAWFGTTKPFDTLTQTFVDTPHGPFNAHHYRYTTGMSTFIVECATETWSRTGFETMSEAQSLAICQTIFAKTLQGHPLVANRSLWRNFPKLWCDRWVHRNIALIGDAAHTAHFSVGSGTRLALEDAIALVNALEARPGDVSGGLTAYDTNRRPVARKIVDAAVTSASWYEQFGEHMALSPYDFAMSYITRSGRLDRQKLAALSPEFVAAYDHSKRSPIAAQ